MNADQTDFVGLILLVVLSVWHGRTERYGSFWMILFRLPATSLHESSHFVFSLLTRSRPTGFSIWPHRDGAVWILGSVTSSNIGKFSALLVGLAPPLVCIPLAWLAFQEHSLFGYVGVYVCLTAAVPSAADVEVAFVSVVGTAFWTAVAFALWWRFGNLGDLLFF